MGVTDGLGDFNVEVVGPEAFAAADLLVKAVSSDRALAGYSAVAFFPAGIEVELMPARFHTVAVRPPPTTRAEDVKLVFDNNFGLQPAERLPNGELRIGPFIERWAQAMAIAKGLQEAWLPLRSDEGSSPPPERIEVELAPPRPLTGRVTDGGKPVAGATVVVDPEACPATATTGADGSFSVARARALWPNHGLRVDAWKGSKSGSDR